MINIPGIGPVRQMIDPDHMTIVNTTQPGHVLYPGNVFRSIVQEGDNLYVVTQGYGTGVLPRLNEIAQYPMWKLTDFGIRRELSPEPLLSYPMAKMNSAVQPQAPKDPMKLPVGQTVVDGPSSVATAQSPVSDVSAPGFVSHPADELYAERNRAARLLAGAGGYVVDRPIPTAQAASPSGSLYGKPMTDIDGYSPQPPIRRLVGQIVDDPRTPAFNTGLPAAPSASNLVLHSDLGNWFGDSFENRTSTEAGDTPRQSQDSAPSYSAMFLQYLNQLTAEQSHAPTPSSNIDATNPYQSVPPIFAPPDYSSATGNGSIEKWIASLAGVDPDDPTKFQAPPIYSPLHGR